MNTDDPVPDWVRDAIISAKQRGYVPFIVVIPISREALLRADPAAHAGHMADRAMQREVKDCIAKMKTADSLFDNMQE